jgi:tRNA A37 threonylcarbamoyladenosine biosynthesis protein TsaE
MEWSEKIEELLPPETVIVTIEEVENSVRRVVCKPI